MSKTFPPVEFSKVLTETWSKNLTLLAIVYKYVKNIFKDFEVAELLSELR